MYRTNTEPADASPTVQSNTLENHNDSITRNNNFNRTPCSIWRARTPLSKRRLYQQVFGLVQLIKPSNGFTGTRNCDRRTTAALWSWRIFRNGLPPISRRTDGGGGPSPCWTKVVSSRSFRLDGTPAWNPSMALAGTRRDNFIAYQSHGARTCSGNRSRHFTFYQFQFTQFHIVWQRWSIALAAWSLVCPTLPFKHSRKDFATCQ